MSIPALEEMEDSTEDSNPFADAELVIYSSEAEWAEEEPTHDNLGELDLVSWSLWARWEDDGFEVPIVGESSWHIWYSLSDNVFNPDPAEPLSDAFVKSIRQMVEENEAGEWGAIDEDTWQETTDLEKYIVHLVRRGFLQMDAPEPAFVIDWCDNHAEVDTE